jgi:plastocyanin
VGGRRFSARRVVAALAVVGATAFGAGQALGASEAITTSTTCCSYGKTSFTIDRGATATFQNQDPGSSPHDVTAFDTGGAKNLPLFRSAVINLGQTPVNGTESLGAGTYRFFCTVHPTQMSAQLVVTPSASPTVAVTILSRKLGPVASSGKLKVKLRGLLASNSVSLTARVGKRKLGTARGIDLSAGASRTVKVPLSRSGKNFLSGRGAARVKVTATPPGDTPVSATQRLH